MLRHRGDAAVPDAAHELSRAKRRYFYGVSFTRPAWSTGGASLTRDARRWAAMHNDYPQWVKAGSVCSGNDPLATRLQCMAPINDPSQARRLDEHPGEGATRGTQRMEIFADAVFAIAFTLPVLELKMPEPGSGFVDRLLDLWPAYLGYLLSAAVIGIYWVHHHFSGAIYRTAGHHFLLATILFLTAIGFISYPTRAFAEHVQDPVTRAEAAIFYTCALAATAVTWLIKWKTGCATGDIDDRLEPAYVARLSRKYYWTTALMMAAAAISFAHWPSGLVLAAAVTLSYLRAPETPAYTKEAPTVEGED